MFKEIFEPLVKALTDLPDRVTVDEFHIASDRVALKVNVPREDLAKLVGRKGCNAVAIRALLNSLGGKHKMSVTINIEESDGSNSSSVSSAG